MDIDRAPFSSCSSYTNHLTRSPDALALDQRLSALADTVCAKDPRTRDQRRADAAGANARGADRLACLCGTKDCPAGAVPPAGGVVVYVVAHQDTVQDAPAGPGSTPPDALQSPEDSAPADPALGVTAGDGARDEPAPSDTAEVPTERESPSPNHPPNPEVITPAEECAALDGPEPAMFDKPLHDLMAGAVLPGSVSRRAAANATLLPILHPGNAPRASPTSSDRGT